jgi:hypothetical protein
LEYTIAVITPRPNYVRVAKRVGGQIALTIAVNHQDSKILAGQHVGHMEHVSCLPDPGLIIENAYQFRHRCGFFRCPDRITIRAAGAKSTAIKC